MLLLFFLLLLVLHSYDNVHDYDMIISSESM